MNAAENDRWLDANAARVLAGDSVAVGHARRIYESGEFDPGFGRDLCAALVTKQQRDEPHDEQRGHRP